MFALHIYCHLLFFIGENITILHLFCQERFIVIIFVRVSKHWQTNVE